MGMLEFWGELTSLTHWPHRIWKLRSEVEELRGRVAQLAYENALMKEAYLENFRLRRLLNFKERSPYRLIPAEVTGKNYEGFSHALILNVGRVEGVEKDLPVVTDKGLVGRVVVVGHTYSVVQLLSDINFRVSALVQRSRVVGVVAPQSDGGFKLLYVPLGSDVRRGDVLVTSGYSEIFPQGLKIGVVTEVFHPESSLFEEIFVQPAEDLEKLEEVFLLKPHP